MVSDLKLSFVRNHCDQRGRVRACRIRSASKGEFETLHNISVSVDIDIDIY